MPAADTLLEFPCRFPLKVIGHARPELRDAVLAIVQRHVPSFDPAALTMRESAGGRYLAFSIEFMAESKAQLDALYREASAHPWIVMVL